MGSTIRVIFSPHPSFQGYSETNVPVNVPINVPVNLQLNERQIWFLEQLGEGKHLRSPDLQKQWQVSGKTAKRDILALQEHKLIEFIGSPKKETYKLILK